MDKASDFYHLQPSHPKIAGSTPATIINLNKTHHSLGEEELVK